MASVLFNDLTVVVRGGGDLGSGAIYRLRKAGFPVIVTELPMPLLVRRTVAYGSAVYDDHITVEGIMAQRVDSALQASELSQSGGLPVLVDPNGNTLLELSPAVIVDARMEKKNLGTKIDDAPVVIALGPGFTAGIDCDVVIETMRGHTLGRAITDGHALPDSGEPGKIGGKTHSRILRAPQAGYVEPCCKIGDMIQTGNIVARVGGQPIVAAFDGILRGLVHPSVRVSEGMKVGDLDPRANREHCFTISDKSLAIGGGVVEAIFSMPYIQTFLSN